MSRRNDIVWDLDDTLIHTIFVNNEQLKQRKTDPQFSYLKGRSVIKSIVDINDNSEIGKGDVFNALVILRQGAREILQYSLENFENVIIWSAGHKRYVRAIVNILIDPNHPAYKEGRIRILTRQDCNEISGSVVLKDLKSKGFDLSRTLMVDDNVTTYRNNFDNAIPINAYNPNFERSNIEYNDITLPSLIEWFNSSKINQSRDVRAVDKTAIPNVSVKKRFISTQPH